jgi:Mor family transcriptional regulator
MGYNKGARILPSELIEQIQEYVDGEAVYIPRKSTKRKRWGESTDAADTLKKRNEEIYQRYKRGTSVKALSEQYYISTQGIYKIISKFK